MWENRWFVTRYRNGEYPKIIYVRIPELNKNNFLRISFDFSTVYLKFFKAEKLWSFPSFRSSRSEVLLVNSILKICSECTEEHPCRDLISIKLQSNFIEITLRHECFPVNLLHIFRTRLLRTPLDGCFFLIPHITTFEVQTIQNILKTRIKNFNWIVGKLWQICGNYSMNLLLEGKNMQLFQKPMCSHCHFAHIWCCKNCAGYEHLRAFTKSK